MKNIKNKKEGQETGEGRFKCARAQVQVEKKREYFYFSAFSSRI